MSSSGRVKVRCHPGATIHDMYDHVKPHLRKSPASIIVHVGSNDASKPPADVVRELLDLRNWIASASGAAVAVSMPTTRDDRPTEARNIREIQGMLQKATGVALIDNANITTDHLSKRKLHLNMRGTRLLAKNMLDYIRMHR